MPRPREGTSGYLSHNDDRAARVSCNYDENCDNRYANKSNWCSNYSLVTFNIEIADSNFQQYNVYINDIQFTSKNGIVILDYGNLYLGSTSNKKSASCKFYACNGDLGDLTIDFSGGGFGPNYAPLKTQIAWNNGGYNIAGCYYEGVLQGSCKLTKPAGASAYNVCDLIIKS